MTPNNVQSLLLLHSDEKCYSKSFLFCCAHYWAKKGIKTMYISRTPVNDIPYSVGCTNKPVLETFSRIRFMYLPRWQDLLQQLYTIHQNMNPVNVIIVHELDYYCKSDGIDEKHDRVSLICASILNAASICAIKTSKPAYVICDYFSSDEQIQKTIAENFFLNIWQLKEEKDENYSKKITVKKLKSIKSDKVDNITLLEDSIKECLNITQAFKTSEKTIW